jgi:hypothetical protein
MLGKASYEHSCRCSIQRILFSSQNKYVVYREMTSCLVNTQLGGKKHLEGNGRGLISDTTKKIAWKD